MIFAGLISKYLLKQTLLYILILKKEDLKMKKILIGSIMVAAFCILSAGSVSSVE